MNCILAQTLTQVTYDRGAMCDTFATFGSSGMLFAKNSDRAPSEVQIVEWHPARRADGEICTQYLQIPDAECVGVLLSRPTWLFGAEHGVNECGVAVGNEKLHNRRDMNGPDGLIGMDLVRLTLERARTAEQGLEILTSLLATHGQGGNCEQADYDSYDSSFLIGDAEGGWIVETSGREWVAAPTGSHGAISNGYGLGRDWTRSASSVATGASVEAWRDPAVDTRRADHRLAATSRCARSTPAPEDAVATLRHHGAGPWGAPGKRGTPQPPPSEIAEDFSGITVCMHNPAIRATTASMLCQVPVDSSAPTRVWSCLGSPCVGVYVPFSLPFVPGFLSDSGIWQMTAVVRDRVDADHEWLLQVRALLDPLEDELWEEAESLTEASEEGWTQFGRTCGERVIAAYRHLTA